MDSCKFTLRFIFLGVWLVILCGSCRVAECRNIIKYVDQTHEIPGAPQHVSDEQDFTTQLSTQNDQVAIESSQSPPHAESEGQEVDFDTPDDEFFTSNNLRESLWHEIADAFRDEQSLQEDVGSTVESHDYTTNNEPIAALEETDDDGGVTAESLVRNDDFSSETRPHKRRRYRKINGRTKRSRRRHPSKVAKSGPKSRRSKPGYSSSSSESSSSGSDTSSGSSSSSEERARRRQESSSSSTEELDRVKNRISKIRGRADFSMDDKGKSKKKRRRHRH